MRGDGYKELENTRYKYLVCPVGLYHSLKGSPSCSEWIDVCYKWLFKNMQCVLSIEPFCLPLTKYSNKPTSTNML